MVWISCSFFRDQIIFRKRIVILTTKLKSIEEKLYISF